MTTQLLTQRGARPRPALTVFGDCVLDRARVHEICGPAKRTMALMVAAAAEGPVLWITPRWSSEALFGPGVAGFIAPGRLVILRPRRAEDLLWSVEEALRSGAVGLVVAELYEVPGLTPVRRLQLAAEAGAAVHGLAPLGLLLTPGAGGAQGVETRWHMAPRHSFEVTRWHLERRRARTLPPKGWTVEPAPGGGWRMLE